MKNKKDDYFPEDLLGMKLAYKYGDHIGLYLNHSDANHIKHLRNINQQAIQHELKRQTLCSMELGQMAINFENIQHLKININKVSKLVREFERKRIDQGKLIWLRNNPPELFYSFNRAATPKEYQKSGGRFNMVFVEEDHLGNLEMRHGFSNPEQFPQGIEEELLEEFQNKISDW